jgi:hypothetical protein
MITWHLYRNGQQEGPYTLEQIEDLAPSFGGDTLVFDNDSQQWVPLVNIPLLAKFAPVAYFCHRNGEQLGPFTVAQLKAQLATGALSPVDLAFIADAWIPLEGSPLWESIRPAVAAPETAAPAAVEPVAAAAPVAETEAPAAASVPAALQFPCKNHPDRESFLMCRHCKDDFCEECLIEVGGTRYCKECHAAGHAAETQRKAGSLFSKLFKK